MGWLKLEFHAAEAGAEQLAERLEALGATAVTIRSAAADEVLEPPPGATPMWRAMVVAALFALDSDVATRLGELPAPVHVDFVGDADWTQAWRQYAVDRCFGERLALAPKDAPPRTDARVEVRLDPGLAFGTGGHPTTALCLEWLAARALDGAVVLDYGCGSGILAIAAARLGAAHVTAVDYDDQALAATRDNARANGVLDTLTIASSEGWSAAGVFDVVVANILSGTLIALADRLAASTAPGGDLVLSGILEAQAGAVQAAFPGFDFLPPAREDGWVLLHGQRARG